ncbi:CRISPR-associated endonuclease Cas3'' [Actinoplanes sp. NPDC051346]|uniref:CRISPR-associated endonuclease Cas3'' n=1 Tax=Actinoplanes sp. NPDC051346 TaxID=3155048 RepID=UPI00343E0954
MRADAVLSDAARVVWGKSGDLVRPLPLWRHLADSADVAGLLWDRWLPRTVRDRVSSELPAAEDGRRLVCWLAGVHDIGKATPAFASQVPLLARRMQDHGFAFDSRVDADRRLAPHATAGFLILSDWLGSRCGRAPADARALAVVVGGHHGLPPTDSDLKELMDRPYLVEFQDPWLRVRDELLDWIAARAGVDERLPHWDGVALSQPVQALLTGVVIVADWIASNEDYFPYSMVLPDGAARLAAGWEGLDLPAPWRAVPPPEGAHDLYAARFALPEGARPRPVQETVVEAARRMPAPGLLVVEAPMGEGKTEAALAAVEILAERTGAGGCFVALPTRATSDAMFSRVLEWLRRLPDADTARGAHGVALAHGKARLNTEFTALYEAPLPSQVGVDDGGAEVAAHRWLAGRKRTMLSGFVIGTIDQLLFTALRQRHLVLRHLGLAGKVVVIDEAHAYDVYMSQYLDRALEWLGAYGVAVVVLSATLPARRRAEMMRAYDDGRWAHQTGAHQTGVRRAGVRRAGVRRAGVRRGRSRERASRYRALGEDLRYPLVSFTGDRVGSGRGDPLSGGSTGDDDGGGDDGGGDDGGGDDGGGDDGGRGCGGGGVGGGEPTALGCAASSRASVVDVEHHDDDPTALAATLRAALADGGCAVVIRNTVSRVQQTAAVLRREFGSEIAVSVAHSRFIGPDRAAKDRWLLRTFGSPEHVRRSGGTRPFRHVVVASQVAEQSLDIDFDLLVTDLAPVDLLLQRIGRLHRHRRPPRPAAVARPRCLITGADWTTEPPTPVRGSARVYDLSSLLRSAAVLWPYLMGLGHLGGGPVRLPDDISPLVQAAYGGDPVGPASWQPDLRAAADLCAAEDAQRRLRADTYRLGRVGAAGTDLVAWLAGDIGDAENGTSDGRGRAHVRDDGPDTLEVLVLSRTDEGLSVVPWLDECGGRLVPTDAAPPPALARAVASCTLALPAAMVSGSGMARVIDELRGRTFVKAWQRDPWLGGELILDLDADGHAEVAGFDVHYDSDDGLRVARITSHG